MSQVKSGMGRVRVIVWMRNRRKKNTWGARMLFMSYFIQARHTTGVTVHVSFSHVQVRETVRGLVMWIVPDSRPVMWDFSRLAINQAIFFRFPTRSRSVVWDFPRSSAGSRSVMWVFHLSSQFAVVRASFCASLAFFFAGTAGLGAPARDSSYENSSYTTQHCSIDCQYFRIGHAIIHIRWTALPGIRPGTFLGFYMNRVYARHPWYVTRSGTVSRLVAGNFCWSVVVSVLYIYTHILEEFRKQGRFLVWRMRTRNIGTEWR